MWTQACADEGPALECGEGTIVVGGRCEPTELRDDGAADAGAARCGPGTVEVSGDCRALGVVGAPCQSGRDCVSGSCLSEEDEGQPGGYCSVINCNERRPCPGGARCVFTGRVGRSICLATCDIDASCRADGYACQPLYSSPASVCAQRCDVVAEGVDACGGTAVCDGDSGRCVPLACELSAGDPCNTAASGRRCAPDRLGLGDQDGLCLRQCDPAQPGVACALSEVCQPVPGDADGGAVCASPLCAVTADCPAGATCMQGACIPPPGCQDGGDCDDGGLCVSGNCVAACPTAEAQSCADLHPGLSCEPSLGACLPTGGFPGSACRPGAGAGDDGCDPLQVGDDAVPMHCVEQQCVPDCASGGDALCQAISPALACAAGVFDATVCLPAGSFPGGACAADDSCAAITVGEASIEMGCLRGSCAPVCDTQSDGDLLCAGLDASLVCADGLGEGGTDLCLPRGQFPGGPCGAGDSCGEGMVCEDSRCLYACDEGGDAVCAGVAAGISCAVGVYAHDVCLPNGSYPGGPCGAGDVCAQDLGGVQAADMRCRAGRCAVDCDESAHWPGYGDALCGFVSPSLTCSESGGDVCVPACQGGQCPASYSCLDPGEPPGHENACLPDGSFPGSACAEGDLCAPLDGGLTQVCAQGTCAVDCSGGSDGLCEAVSAALTCEDNTGLCVVKCQGGMCPDGYACLPSEQACLPIGSFLGSPCAPGDVCAAGGSPPLTCVPGAPPTCAASCGHAGDGDAYCVQLALAVGVPFTTCLDIGGPKVCVVE